MYCGQGTEGPEDRDPTGPRDVRPGVAAEWVWGLHSSAQGGGGDVPCWCRASVWKVQGPGGGGGFARTLPGFFRIIGCFMSEKHQGYFLEC